MPLYEYEHEQVPAAGSKCLPRFEVFRSMADRPLDRCPTCGGACRKVYAPFAVAAQGAKGILSKSNLESHGFTQFTRKGEGYYEKSAGAGPGAIAAGD